MRPPNGIWESLLRFIGVGILKTWGIIHGKAPLTGLVYKMRQGWQRWRPTTAGPSCLNMGLSHLTCPWQQLQPFSVSQQTHTPATDWHTIEQHWAQLQIYKTSKVWNWNVLTCIQTICTIFTPHNKKTKKNIFTCHNNLFSSWNSFEDFIGIYWVIQIWFSILTTASCTATVYFENQTEHLGYLFKKPWRYSVYSAISSTSQHTLFGLIRWKHEDHLQLY